MSIHQRNKAHFAHFRGALYDCESEKIAAQLKTVFAPDAQIHLASPIGDLRGADALYHTAYAPLLKALPDMERRDFIVIAGGHDGQNWIGCGGHYLGTFEHPWLGIPATRQPVYMRYAEFFRYEDEQVVEMQAIWDIPQVMMQARAWPLAPSLGQEWMVPAPATLDGIPCSTADPAESQASRQLILSMLTTLGQHPMADGPEIMKLDQFWHPKMMWYGPAGIGSMRQISGFRDWHQIPFLKALPDRHGAVKQADIFFAEGGYVGTTGWPNMAMTVSGDGWLGIAPAHQEITMRSLDFWRIENGLIRENWVLIDLLHVYDQLGLDVFSRMKEITVDRQPRYPDRD